MVRNDLLSFPTLYVRIHAYIRTKYMNTYMHVQADSPHVCIHAYIRTKYMKIHYIYAQADLWYIASLVFHT